MSEILRKDALKVLCDLATKGIMDGIAHSYTPITQEIWEELAKYNMVDRAPGNDGDYPYHGKVRLSVGFGAMLSHRLLLSLTDFLLELQPDPGMTFWEKEYPGTERLLKNSREGR